MVRGDDEAAHPGRDECLVHGREEPQPAAPSGIGVSGRGDGNQCWRFDVGDGVEVDDHVEVALPVHDIAERPGQQFAAEGVEVAADGEFDGAQVTSDVDGEP